jgi:hypothetical protein
MDRLFIVALLAAASLSGVTFHKDALPILQAKCQGCHRAGEAAPMPLLTYAEVRPWAKAIRGAVANGKMPPWFADRSVGHFTNDKSLTARERETLLAWVDEGAKEGNPKDGPAPREFATGWTIGKPDAIFDMGVDFTVPASGTVEYTYFVVKAPFKEDKWVEKVELRPGARSVVHHIVLMNRAAGSSMHKQAEPGVPFVPKRRANHNPPPDSGQGSLNLADNLEIVSVYVPGGDAYATRPGQARLIKAGSDLLFQMHYTANGKETVDRSQVGFVFAKEPPRERVVNTFISNTNLRIPPGASNHRVDARVKIENDVTLQSMFPHSHLRGRSWEYAVTYPDGREEVLLKVPKYDFNWQMTYFMEKPLVLPKGSILRTTAWFDNSPNNASNPDPKAEVFWGDQSWEEMLAGFVDFVIPVGDNPEKLMPPKKAKSGD